VAAGSAHHAVRRGARRSAVPSDEDVACLVVSCPDRPGIVAAVSTVLAELGANIVNSAQHSTDPENGTFFLRMVFHLGELGDRVTEVEEKLGAVAARFAMDWRLALPWQRVRVVIFVSKEDHCLADLLWRWQRNELDMDIVEVVSNHPDHAASVEALGIPFRHIPVSHDTKPEAEREALRLLSGNVDLVILARYMQILSPDFLAGIGAPVINIHHSFLPAFVGQNPYVRAHERGVKLIGATAHYATADLDEGPIIEQDVHRVSHVYSAEDLTRVGRDVERVVLARAVLWHLEHRVLVHENRTVVFLS
jgi:formyltetrahydrofolate deformylase